eukprot:10703921-Heterocapsa_arctica.AAC.1
MFDLLAVDGVDFDLAHFEWLVLESQMPLESPALGGRSASSWLGSAQDTWCSHAPVSRSWFSWAPLICVAQLICCPASRRHGSCRPRRASGATWIAGVFSVTTYG